MTAASRTDRSSRRTRAVVLVLCGVQFVDVLGVTVVITALPQLLADLNANSVEGTVVVTAYAAVFGGLLMVAARAGDRVGHRRIVLAALALFGAAAALGALAPSVWVLASARALQGAAAAASVPAALRLLTTLTTDGPERRRAVAGWSAAGATAGATGFVVGGVLTELTTWRAVFVAFVGLAVVLAVGIGRSVPPDRPISSPARIAWLPGLLLTAAAMAIVAGGSLLSETGVLGGGLLAAGGAAAFGFVVAERRASTPLVGAAAWRSASLRWGTLGSFVNTATTSGSFTVAMLYLQDDLGLGPLRAAGAMVPLSLMVVVGSAAAPRLVASTGWGRTLGCGIATIGAGNVLLVAWPSTLGVATAAAVSGLGLGVGSVAATDMGTHVTGALKAVAAGAINTAAQLGTALGTALAVLVAMTLSNRTAWLLTAGLAVAAASVAARLSPQGPSTQGTATRVAE
jgi:MFS family permease